MFPIFLKIEYHQWPTTIIEPPITQCLHLDLYLDLFKLLIVMILDA